MRCLISHPKTHESSIAAPFELTSGGSKQKCQMIISSLGIYQNKIRKKSNTTVSTFDIHIHSMYIYIYLIYTYFMMFGHYPFLLYHMLYFQKIHMFHGSKILAYLRHFSPQRCPRTDSPPVPSPRVISPPDRGKKLVPPARSWGERLGEEEDISGSSPVNNMWKMMVFFRSSMVAGRVRCTS